MKAEPPVAEVVLTPSAAMLACPYPGCAGLLAESDLREQLVVCPECHRLSARCTRQGSDGACRTLNRPLSGFCRHCRQDLGAGWAQAAWLTDALAHRSAAALGSAPAETALTLGDPEPVLSLRDWLPPDPLAAWPMELCEAAGCLWIGARDGRYLFVEPFADRSPKPVLAREQLWPGSPARLRATVSGSWMLVYSENGIKALNLLTLEGGAPGADRHLTLWEAKDGQRLAAAPVLLQGAPADGDPLTGQQRTAVWLTREGGQGLMLRAAPLVLGDRRSGPSGWRLPEEPARGTASADDQDRAFLLRVPLGRRDRALLCRRGGLWLIDLLGSTGNNLTLRPLLKERGAVTRPDDLPGAVFLPGQLSAATAQGDDPTGRVFVTCEDARGGRRLFEVSLAADGSVAAAPYGDYGGTPIDVAEARGLRGVLCHHGQALTLCNWMHQQVPAGSSMFLDGLARAHVYGRFAVCTGTTTEGVPPQWFLLLMDLERGRIADEAVIWPGAAGHPVVLGRYLFILETLEPRAGGPRPGLYLTRRELLLKAEAG
jgi:hypothetical protein